MTTTESTSTAGPSFTAPLPVLTEALAALTAVTGNTRPATPALGGVLVDAYAAGACLTVFDYDNLATVRLCDAVIKELGRALLDRRDLTRIVKATTKGETKRATATWDVVFDGTTTSGTREREVPAVRGYRDGTSVEVEPAHTVVEPYISHAVDVTINDFRVPVETLPLDDYPHPPATAEPTFTVDRDLFAAAVTKVAVATGRDATMPMLTGLRIELDHGQVTLAGTDRFRLAIATVAVDPHSPDATGQWLWPAAALTRALKALPTGPITVGLPGDSDSWATLRSDNIEASTRLLDADFPRYRPIIPTEASTTVAVDRGKLAAAAAKACALSKQVGHIQLAVDGPRLTVSPVVDEHQDRVRGATLPANIDGQPTAQITVSGTYLLDALHTFDGPDVALALNPDKRPLLLADNTETLFGDTAHRHLVMPVVVPGGAP